MKKVKISELPLFNNLKGLFVIGTDNLNRSVKVSLEFVEEQTTAAVGRADDATAKALTAKTATENATAECKTATANANKATTAANTATSLSQAATVAANKSKTDCDTATAECKKATSETRTATEETSTATTKANKATQSANEAAETANTAAETALTAKDVVIEMMGRLIPTGLKVSCLDRITISNVEPVYIKTELSPVTALKNIIFISDNRAAIVDADGKITPISEGKSRISIIPTCNTALAKTILVEVGRPLARLVNSKSSLRLSSGRLFRLT